MIAHDPLGVFADRRITDVIRDADPAASLRQRADDYAPGDTDLAWTRITPWRAALATAFDTVAAPVESVVVEGNPVDPSAQLLAGWLTSRLHLRVPVEQATGKYISAVDLRFADGREVVDDQRQLQAGAAPAGAAGLDRPVPAAHAPATLLAEELRRLDADHTYADALGAVTGETGLNERSSVRTHIWHDPALARSEG